MNNVQSEKRWVLALVAMLAMVCALVVGGWFVIAYQINQSDHRWCDTLTLLTQKPVSAPSNPSSNPSREGEYRLYRDFVTLKKDFGCG